jgi:hypothetical protein
MRQLFVPVMLAAAVAAAPVLAESPPAPAPAPAAVVAPASPLAGVPFADPPFPISDDGVFAGFMGSVARELGRQCGTLEIYGWEFTAGDQQRMDRIYAATMEAFRTAGYKISRVKAKTVPDPETVIMTADTDKKSLILSWSPLQGQALLQMCDAGTGAGAAVAPVGKKPKPPKAP